MESEAFAFRFSEEEKQQRTEVEMRVEMQREAYNRYMEMLLKQAYESLREKADLTMQNKEEQHLTQGEYINDNYNI
ncbi:hypothetical protein HPP92_003093 [Vanilla planifolia]|uniref:Uncharacterized protein n=1 Tax=Vanilla planifolia TaxID=51239 RepID=A0A835VNB5_VANPL|nr:hypothetical protein HPP92_003467 [Vanilla planifolia]KAG0498781.1 hypothetical protein HPP92_003472 [Vanilla planifolia]KAG0503013.1 hypothetical protein HPP92_003085 [Vanilla planifolia]KAG0503021.1 hypothetical protein HPP92_003093 [Vanilla planifolia]